MNTNSTKIKTVLFCGRQKFFINIVSI